MKKYPKIVAFAGVASVFLTMWANPALAVNKPPPPSHHPHHQAQTQGQSQAQTQGQIQGQSQAQEANATGGDASTSVNVSGDDYDAPAPAVIAIPPVSTMECIRGFGVGASNQNGGIALGPTWKDGDCMALQQFDRLSKMGMALPAATVYCARPRFAKPFGGEEPCRTAMQEHLQWINTPATVEIEKPDTQCREALNRCETTVGGK